MIAETMFERGSSMLILTAAYSLGTLVVVLEVPFVGETVLVSKYCDNQVAKTGFFMGIVPVEIAVDMDGVKPVIKVGQCRGVKVTPIVW